MLGVLWAFSDESGFPYQKGILCYVGDYIVIPDHYHKFLSDYRRQKLDEQNIGMYICSC